MKVAASVRRLYDDQVEINRRLKERVDDLMRSFKDQRWHYESRIKSLQSFALKIESGRFADPARLEDFFACTLVVANISEIEEAEALIRERFTVMRRRPNTAAFTHKATDEFPFDDLRLYVEVADAPTLPPSGLTGVPFEVQIKTFLQHAWSIATHELMYKADDVNWSKERIAYQIKAMLEHAELSILEAEALSGSSAVAKENKRTAGLRSVISLVKSQWGSDELPADVRRLAENITSVIDAMKLDVARLDAIMADGKAAGGGAHPANLSPFGTVVHYLLSAERDRMMRVLTGDGRTKVLIPAELEFPPDIDRQALRNAVFVGEAP